MRSYLEEHQSHTVMDIAEERKTVAEIARLKAAIPLMQEYESRMAIVNLEKQKAAELFKPVKVPAVAARVSEFAWFAQSHLPGG